MLKAFDPLAVSVSESSLLSRPSNGIDLDSITEGFTQSYFSEALNFCLEQRREFYEANKKFYRTIVESGNDTAIIHEGFGDFFNTVKKIIDKFLDFIKRLFSKFILTMNSFVKSESYLKKCKDEFSKFNGDCNFTMDGYTFTINPDIPVVNAKASWNDNSFFVDVYDGNTSFSLTPADSKTSLKDTIKSHSDMLNRAIETGDWFDNFRAEVLGRTHDMIYQDEYAKELFREYRDGKETSSDMDITSTEVMEALNRFTNHDKVLSSVKKTKESVDKEYNAIKKHLDKMMSINFSGGNKTATINDPDGAFSSHTLTGDEITKMDLYIKAKINQIQQMSSIHTLAFSAKIDAVNDCFKQDKNLLYKALSKINSKVKL